MIEKGALVVVSRHDLMESYVAELMEDFHPHRRVNPAVRIRQLLVYPRQTAIIDDVIVSENQPIGAGTVTRLPFVCRWPADRLPFQDDAQSVRAALEDYLEEARAEGRSDILAILLAHERGEYGRRRRPAPVTSLRQSME